MKQRVKRVNLSGSVFEKISFANFAKAFMVKNFSDSDIYVSLDEDATENTSIKIPSKCYQIVVGNQNDIGNDFETDEIFVKGSGEVEVQQLWFR